MKVKKRETIKEAYDRISNTIEWGNRIADLRNIGWKKIASIDYELLSKIYEVK